MGRYNWTTKIGLEIHARIKAKSKLFSGASSKFVHKVSNPNQQVAFFDAGIPGTLPVINVECVNQAILTGLALGGQINNKSLFERKHYFYGDSPLGYQITQQRDPIVSHGSLDFRYLENDTAKQTTPSSCRITRIQLEQDTGRLSIEASSSSLSLLDLNRAGTGVMEIVTEPDLTNAEEAAGFVSAMQVLLRYIGACDGNMEDGSLRADVNVSVHSLGIDSHRVEIKNLNSIRGIVKAIEFESNRLQELYSSNNMTKYGAETRSYDAETNTTVSMRSKEGATDYRFFPEPDLPTLCISEERIDMIRKKLPLLPEVIMANLQSEYGIPEFDARQIFFQTGCLDYLYQVISYAPAEHSEIFPKLAAQWICNSILEIIKDTDKTVDTCGISPKVLGEIINLVQLDTISHANGKSILALYIKDGDVGKTPIEIANERGLVQLNDQDSLKSLCYITIDKIKSTKKGSKNLEMYLKGGKVSLLGFFVGQALAESKGRANPRLLNTLMQEILEEMK